MTLLPSFDESDIENKRLQRQAHPKLFLEPQSSTSTSSSWQAQIVYVLQAARVVKVMFWWGGEVWVERDLTHQQYAASSQIIIRQH